MTRTGVLAATTAFALTVGLGMVQQASAQQNTVKIGYVSTFSGPTAAIGNHMRNGFELALDHLGRKFAGLPVEVIYEDDTQKPDVGVQKTQKLIESDHVDFMVGYIWSNVLLASSSRSSIHRPSRLSPMPALHRFPANFARPTCSRPRGTTIRTPEAMGMYMNQRGIRKVFQIGPNYVAGKDMLQGMRNTYQGEVIGQEMTRWPDQLDFSAELSKARAMQPEAIFAFYPSTMESSSSRNTSKPVSRDKSRSIKCSASTSYHCRD